MRSKLFVPGSRPELFDKALTGPADALSFDLEDAVSPARKPAARAALQALLASPAARGSRQTLIVRVNALDTPFFADDVAAVTQPGLQWLNLPKAETVDQVRWVAQAMEAAERANGVPHRIGLLLNIESPGALRRAAELAAAHPRVVGLQLGLGDLFEPLGIRRRDELAVRQVMLQLRLAAGEAGVFAYDGAFAQHEDSVGFRTEAGWSRALGFLGKSCIHPRQVPLANEVYLPRPEEIARAERIVAAAVQAEADGLGAFTVDGQMVDAPFVARARQLLAQQGRSPAPTPT